MWNNKISFLPVKRRAKKRTEIIFSLNSCCASACCVYFFVHYWKENCRSEREGGRARAKTWGGDFQLSSFFCLSYIEGVEIPSRTNSFSKARKNIKHYWAKCLRPELLSTDLKDHRSKWLLLLNSLPLPHSLFMLRCRNRTQQKARKAISIKMYEIK